MNRNYTGRDVHYDQEASRYMTKNGEAGKILKQERQPTCIFKGNLSNDSWFGFPVCHDKHLSVKIGNHFLLLPLLALTCGFIFHWHCPRSLGLAVSLGHTLRIHLSLQDFKLRALFSLQRETTGHRKAKTEFRKLNHAFVLSYRHVFLFNICYEFLPLFFSSQCQIKFLKSMGYWQIEKEKEISTSA